jgi:hypothetical protein
MFIKAIETASQFTRPIHVIARFWGTTTVVPEASTLFFVNADGWALTCKHVAGELLAAGQVAKKYADFRAERDQIPPDTKTHQLIRALERKYDYEKGVCVEFLPMFMNCGAVANNGPVEFQCRLHAELDIALLKFDFQTLHVPSFPIFAANGADLRQGKSLCRLGFPFPEFSNFTYDEATDEIRWAQTGQQDTPQFPLDGIMTRNVLANGQVVAFEMSTPGLRGQSGGPVFDVNGKVWGMQYATHHIDLDFDVDMKVLRMGEKKSISESALLHVGHCIHVDRLKDFMRQHQVAFQES